VNAVFITVDPERDTPDVVSNYVKSFGPRFVGLSGSPSQIEGVAKAYRVYYRKADPQPGSSFYTMDHSALIYLMDQNGDYVTHFSFSADPDKIAEVLKKHLVAAKLA
jgi:protein SCO1/2